MQYIYRYTCYCDSNIGFEALAKFMPGLANYGAWIIVAIAIPWLLFSYAVRRFGRKIGPRAMYRFYTREEMYKILAGDFPLNAQREKSIQQELEYLYK